MLICDHPCRLRTGMVVGVSLVLCCRNLFPPDSGSSLRPCLDFEASFSDSGGFLDRRVLVDSVLQYVSSVWTRIWLPLPDCFLQRSVQMCLRLPSLLPFLIGKLKRSSDIKSRSSYLIERIKKCKDLWPLMESCKETSQIAVVVWDLWWWLQRGSSRWLRWKESKVLT